MCTFIGKWWKNIGGTTAVEFALVGVPFVIMSIGTIEMALMFTSQSVLQEATFAAARVIRTGQVQLAGGTEELFRQEVCDFAELLIPCAEIQFQVQNLPSFQDAQDEPDPTFDEDGNLQDQGFDPGDESDVVMIRVVYNYPVRTPLLQPALSNASGGRRTMLSTIVLQTEPYE